MCLGIPGRIVRIEDARKKLALADVAGVQRQVNLACTPDARVGDWVLIHVGFAMARLDEQQAAETLRILKELGEAL
ncbi:MAG TPA: HypC/HybG/HupF family hydrogenase formation chaperone [Burkholderiales bacterium]|nr:HypC/HybG/HupF family hydrogenase formation chaperone [Burkholderiales bacterium]